MSKMIIKRVASNWQDKLRDYIVLVDGKKIANVSNGSEVEFEVEPGKHTVQLKIDWCYSPEFDVMVSANESVGFECGPNAKPYLVLLYITLWRNKYIWLRNST